MVLKDPKGGLTAEGRKAFGGNLKPGVKNYDEASDADKKRWISWALRFYGRDTYPPLKKPNGEPSRFALTAAAWGEPVPSSEAEARAIAAKARKRQTQLSEVSKYGKGRDYTIPSPLSSAKEISGSHNHRPAGTSIRWPAMYRELRKKGYSKRKAAMISNGKWRKKHGLPPKSRGAVELAKTSTTANRAPRRLKDYPRDALKRSLKEPAVLNDDDFIFKAGTRAGAIKGWVTRRRNAGVSMDSIVREGRDKYGDDFERYAPLEVAQHVAATRLAGRSTRARPAVNVIRAVEARGTTGNTRSRRAAAMRRQVRSAKTVSDLNATTNEILGRDKESRKRSAKIAVLEGIVQGGIQNAEKQGIDYNKAVSMLRTLRSEEAAKAPVPSDHKQRVQDEYDRSFNGTARESSSALKASADQARAAGDTVKADMLDARRRGFLDRRKAAKKPAAKKTTNPMEYKFTGKNADLDDDNWSILSLRHERQMTLDGDPAAQGFDIEAIDAKIAQIRIMYDDPTRPMPESMADRAARGGPSVGDQMAAGPMEPPTPSAPKPKAKTTPGVNKAMANANAKLKKRGLSQRITRADIDRVARDSVFDEGTTQAELDEIGMTIDIVERDIATAKANIIHHLTSGRTGPFKDFMDELVDSGDLLSAMDILTAESRGKTYTIA